MAGRILYAMLFTAVLPALLVLWAWRLEPAIALPEFHEPWTATGLVLLGLILMTAGMWSLWNSGGGLPMNAYPPPRFVADGIYRYLSQPIYIGFVMLCAGISLFAWSRAGLWVVTPLVAGGAAALVWGYERHDLRRRFGPPPAPLICVPPPGVGSPGAWERISVYLVLFLPWLIAYEALGHVQLSDVRDATFEFERSWPVLLWTEAIYGFTYPFVLLAPLAARSRDVLRRFTITGLVATVVGCLAYLAIPLVAPPRPFEGAGWLADLQRLERSDALNGYAACPSFHVTFALLAAWVYASRWPRWAPISGLFALAIAASCLTTGMHALVDIPAGFVLFAVAFWSNELWRRLLRFTERTANDWHEWRIGPLRIINYGLYAGLAACVGVAGTAMLVGREHVAAVALIALSVLAGAGLWGQMVVGSPTLLRPFGYYGGVLGGILGVIVASLAGMDLWILAAALAVTAPWVQLIGRFRCLVQGCCHGAPTTGAWGIRYQSPQSRVVRIGHLQDVPLHPTPVYSMLGNVAIGIVVGRMWSAGAPAPLIVGLYLILAGLARFVEESFRGEPQTPIVHGLRLYQWFALVSVIAGAAVMCVRTTSSISAADPSWAAVLASLPAGVAYLFAMGIDFPQSNRRFSRLC